MGENAFGIGAKKRRKLSPVICMFISFFRTVILYGVIVVTVRLMGKRQIGELEPAELVAAILISDLASVPMQDIGIPLLSGVIPILTLLALELLTAELSLRSIRFRKIFCGRPVYLIQNGLINQQAMTKNQLSIDELQECLRQNGIPDVSQVKFAVLETNGRLSTFLYPEYAPLSAGETGRKLPDLELPVTVISDGRLMLENLRALGRDEAWLDTCLEAEETRRQDVFLMTATPSGRYHLVKKEGSQ